MRVRVGVVLMALAGCPAAPAATDDDGDSGGADTTGGEPSTPDPTMVGPTAPQTASASMTGGTACVTDDCATSGPPDTGDPPTELSCDDDLDEDGDGAEDCFDADCWEATLCTNRFLRVATWNVRNIGMENAYAQLLAVIERIDADIICLQEVDDDEGPAFAAVADATGYAETALAPAGRPGAGEIRSGCMSRHEIVQWDALAEPELSSDPFASDMARAILRVRVYVERLDRYVTVLSAHLKAGEEDTDQFRRMVESVRLGVAVDIERDTYPDNGIIVLGDLNEEPQHPQGISFTAPPPGLPPSFALGNDIGLPLPYAPLSPLDAAGLTAVDATVEDAPWGDTYLPSLVRLDYIFEDAASLVVSEVYEACQDDGVDDAPVGDRMPKRGEPLPCGANGDASDHRPVVAVFYF